MERLRTRIGILERNGQHGIASRLRDELAERERGIVNDDDAVESEWTPREPAVIEDDAREAGAVELFNPIKRLVFRLGIEKAADLAHWDLHRFRLAGVKQADIEFIYRTMAALGLTGIIGSGDVPDTVPAPNPYAIDMLQGVLRDDILYVGTEVAYGRLTQREASVSLGTAEEEMDYGHAHQRWGSAFDRHSDDLAPIFAEAFEAEFTRAEWFVSAAVEPIPQAWRRGFGLRITARCSKAELVRTIRAADLNGADKGRGTAKHSWRGISLLFTTSGDSQDVQAQVKKVGGLYRVVDESGVPSAFPSGKPLDRGGYNEPGRALARVNVLNANPKPTRKQKRAGRSAEIAAKRKDGGGEVHER